MNLFERAEAIARENVLSRKTLNWGFDKSLNQFQVTVEVSGYQCLPDSELNVLRTETDIYFVVADNAPDALQAARAQATLRFAFYYEKETPQPTPPTATASLAVVEEKVEEVPVVEAIVPQEESKRKPGRPKKTTEAPAEKPTQEKALENLELPIAAPVVKEEKKKQVEKTTPYNPDLKEHKILLASFLNKESDKVGNWASNPRTGEYSRTLMRGKPFLNDKGEVLESFKVETFEFFGSVGGL